MFSKNYMDKEVNKPYKNKVNHANLWNGVKTAKKKKKQKIITNKKEPI